MGDRVAVLNAGVLQQVAPTREIYDRPANTFVAGFIGSPAMNLYDIDASVLRRWGFEQAPEGPLTVGIRPEDWKQSSEGEGGVKFVIHHVEELGHESYLYGDLTGEDGTVFSSTTRLGGNTGVLVEPRSHQSIDETIWLKPNTSNVHIFDRESGNRIN